MENNALITFTMILPIIELLHGHRERCQRERQDTISD